MIDAKHATYLYGHECSSHERVYREADFDALEASEQRLRSLLVEARDALRRVGNSSTDELTRRIESEVGHV